VSICDLAIQPWGATWGSAGTIVFASNGLDFPEGGLMQVPADGGTPQPLTRLDRAR